MKTTTLFPSLAILVLLSIARVNAVDTVSQTFRPTWGGDEHDNPVFTSPTNGLSTLTARDPLTNSLPVPKLTNWPVTNLPPITNWPTTNSLPPMTNPPPLNPPGGK